MVTLGHHRKPKWSCCRSQRRGRPNLPQITVGAIWPLGYVVGALGHERPPASFLQAQKKPWVPRVCPLHPRPRSLGATGCYVFVGSGGCRMISNAHAPALLRLTALGFVERPSNLDRALFVVSPTHDLITLARKHDCVLGSANAARLVLGVTCVSRAYVVQSSHVSHPAPPYGGRCLWPSFRMEIVISGILATGQNKGPKRKRTYSLRALGANGLLCPMCS
jgi:hypothetical protein